MTCLSSDGNRPKHSRVSYRPNSSLLFGWYYLCMNIPYTNLKRALIVVDLQPAFIKPHNVHIVSKIQVLIKAVPYDAYVEAVFHAEHGSLLRRYI
jgi:hypothetical protein